MTSFDRILVTSIAVELSDSISKATRREKFSLSRSSLLASRASSIRASIAAAVSPIASICRVSRSEASRAVATARSDSSDSSPICSLDGVARPPRPSAFAAGIAKRGGALRDDRGDRLARPLGRLVGGFANPDQRLDQFRAGIAGDLARLRHRPLPPPAPGHAIALRRAPTFSRKPRQQIFERRMLPRRCSLRPPRPGWPHRKPTICTASTTGASASAAARA